LRDLGYGDEAITIQSRWGEGHVDALPALAAELVRDTPEVIFAGSGVGADALKKATSTIPIVVAAAADLVGRGLIDSLAHPGGNVTGLSDAQEYIVGKRLELLKTAVPRAERIAVLVNPDNPRYLANMWELAQRAAQTLDVKLFSVEARIPDEIEAAFDRLTSQKPDALHVDGDPVFFPERNRITALALSHGFPALYDSKEYTTAGGLMSYGADLNSMFRRAATFVDKILKGAKPADLPVEQPTKYDLVVNLKTARTLGLTIPQLILASANEIIE